jgi:hypothetical protein
VSFALSVLLVVVVSRLEVDAVALMVTTSRALAGGSRNGRLRVSAWPPAATAPYVHLHTLPKSHCQNGVSSVSADAAGMGRAPGSSPPRVPPADGRIFRATSSAAPDPTLRTTTKTCTIPPAMGTSTGLRAMSTTRSGRAGAASAELPPVRPATAVATVDTIMASRSARRRTQVPSWSMHSLAGSSFP